MTDHISNEGAINTIIEATPLNKNLISDGYHTFGELYDHRIALFIALCKQLHIANEDSPVWKSRRHSDGSSFDGWFIMGIFTEHGKQMTYHLPDSKWDEAAFAVERTHAPEWDGHTAAEVVNRLRVFL